MVQQRPRPPASGIGQRPVTPPTGPKKGGAGLWIIGGVVLLGIVAMSQHTSTTTSGSSTINAPMAAQMGSAQQALVSAVAAQKPPPVQTLSPAAVRRGSSRVALAGREGTGGEMIYSQNCYDALGRAFSWHKLDECGGFDAEAAAATDGEAGAVTTELAWFDPETAAGRYLKAATAAGLDATAADERLAGLQRKVGRGHPSFATATPTATATSVAPGGLALPAGLGNDD